MISLISGSDWVVVDPPSSSDPLSQISVGKDVVWGLSKDNKVMLLFSFY